MDGLPLHPAVVHLPLGVAFVMPLLAAAAAVSIWRGWLDKKVWIGVIAVQAIVFGGALVAEETGEDQEEVVEQVVAEEHIEAHEERAEGFIVAAGATLAIAAAAIFIPAESVALAAMGLAVVGTLVVAGLGVGVGHSGGELVFKYGAARAYEQPASTRQERLRIPRSPGEHE